MIAARLLVPGLVVALAAAAAAWLVVFLVGLLPPPLGALPLSAMLVAILIGLLLAVPAQHRPAWQPGLEFARGPLLKAAVALIGLRLSLFELGQLGVQALPLIIIVVMVGLAAALGLARLADSSARLGILLAAGTTMCGASAIAATAPAIRARSDEFAYAIACVALVGLLATIFYPWLLGALFESPTDIGMILGVSIHDTAQVTAAAALHEQISGQQGTLVAATVVKLLRNAGMVIMIPALTWLYARNHPTGDARARLPGFIVAFIALSGVRSLVDLTALGSSSAWHQFVEIVSQASTWAFAMAMVALSSMVQPAQLKKHGWKPAAAAIVAAVVMLTAAVAMTTAFGD